ncbi:MLP-like protein 423 [Diospyros lotus]|uniref:MLP-like protein 423 n=1 Tax=Diospyros lotus TaxID=55363 RepID=UPI00224FAC4A|nr:MLP-like protein 423 [Diospyros lotus]
MKSMRGEVELHIPAEKAWQMYRDNQIAGKINPQLLAAAHYIAGDGRPGSLRLFKLGPAVNEYVKESIEMIEEVEEGRRVTYSVVAGDLRKMYDPYKVTISFVPVEGDGRNKCIAEWKVEFQPLTTTTPPPGKAKDIALRFLKSFENYPLG